DNLVILITEHLSDISRPLVASPQLATIHVNFPDESQRRAFLEDQDLEEVRLEMSPDQLAKITAGLSLIQIRGILRSAALSGDPITFGLVSRRKKKVIEQECHGLVEFVAPEHDFRHVGGMEGVKRDLLRVAGAVRAGHTNRVPM